MSLSSYSALKTSIATWLRRSDLTDAIPDFITMAEADMNRRLRCRRMLSRGTLSITSQLVSAPTDFIEPRSLRLTDQTPAPVVRWVSEQQMDDLLGGQEQTSGVPQHYTLEGASFRFSPDPGVGPYTGSLSYYAAIPALADSNTSNWVLASHPDAYLYGGLTHSAPYLKTDDRLPMWEAKFGQILSNINGSDTGQGALEVMPNTYGAGYV